MAPLSANIETLLKSVFPFLHMHQCLSYFGMRLSLQQFILPNVLQIRSLPTYLARLSKQKPDYSSMHIFGCACWPNLQPYNAHKLQFLSTQCVFLGYNNLHKGFKCLEVSTHLIYISRDVVFDEEVLPFVVMHSNAGGLLHSQILLLTSDFLNRGVNTLTAYLILLIVLLLMVRKFLELVILWCRKQ